MRAGRRALRGCCGRTPHNFVLESERTWSSSRAKAYALCRIRLLKARLTSIESVQTHWSDMKTILQAQTESDDSVVDRSDAWSEQDQEDLTSASLHYAETLYPEDEDLV